VASDSGPDNIGRRPDGAEESAEAEPVPAAATDADRADTAVPPGGGLIFCGMCGALNPAGRYYCAACGTTLVDAFHATEGLRVYERPDSASRLIEIVASGSELEIVEDPDAPEDFARVRLPYGRLGYIRLKEVEAMATAATAPVGASGGRPVPDINTHARGCVSPTAALGALALLVAIGALMLALLATSDTYDQGTILIVFCFGLGPFILLTIGVYLYAKSREDRLAEEEAETEEASKTA
jgi:hypothetical protein